MRYVYIDESGDTGRQSAYLVFASIATDTPRHIEKVIKKIWQAKPNLHPLGELHAYEVDDLVRERVLRNLAAQQITIQHSSIRKYDQTGPLELL